MKYCPDRDLLKRLVNNGLDDTELDETEQHVEGCAACQQTLEELTENTMWRLQLAAIEPSLAIDRHCRPPCGGQAPSRRETVERAGDQARPSRDP
jgi:hypothetical protein